jgi:hypothetical protein
MQSFSMTGNERAKQLSGVDLLREMERHRHNMATLGAFVTAAQFDIKGIKVVEARPSLK